MKYIVCNPELLLQTPNYQIEFRTLDEFLKRLKSALDGLWFPLFFPLHPMGPDPVIQSRRSFLFNLCFLSFQFPSKRRPNSTLGVGQAQQLTFLHPGCSLHWHQLSPIRKHISLLLHSLKVTGSTLPREEEYTVVAIVHPPEQRCPHRHPPRTGLCRPSHPAPPFRRRPPPAPGPPPSILNS